MDFLKSFLVGILGASMVCTPNLVLALQGNGICTTQAFLAYTNDTSSACTGGMCIGNKTEYPTVYRCLFLEWDAEFCDDEVQWYKATVTPTKTKKNNSWGRWLQCTGASAACYSCLVAAAAAGAFGGIVAGPEATIGVYVAAVAATGGGSGIACYLVCGALDAGAPCCTIDCELDVEHITYPDYKKGCSQCFIEW